MAKPYPSISIVIPVYNEEDHIKDCLDAIALQSIMPDEVIVVDNNSTDGSMAIAKKYPFVTVINESKQGLISARNRGFNSAKSEILARIDADAKVGKNWVETAKNDFAAKNIGGLSGLARTIAIPGIPGWYSAIWVKVYYGLCDSYFGVRIMWGTNMAIRKEVWDSIKNEVSDDSRIVHEDQDISCLVAGHGYNVVRDKHWQVNLEGEGFFYWPKYSEYAKRRRQTKRLHVQKGTFAKPQAARLSLWQRLALGVIYQPFQLIFVAGSYSVWWLSRLITPLGDSLKQKR